MFHEHPKKILVGIVIILMLAHYGASCVYSSAKNYITDKWEKCSRAQTTQVENGVGKNNAVADGNSLNEVRKNLVNTLIEKKVLQARFDQLSADCNPCQTQKAVPAVQPITRKRTTKKAREIRVVNTPPPPRYEEPVPVRPVQPPPTRVEYPETIKTCPKPQGENQ